MGYGNGDRGFERAILRSSDSNVFKFIFTKQDLAVEAVLYRYKSFAARTVICCSTQCGCPVGCSFCGTGRGFVRNLSGAEIVDQVLQVMETVEAECPAVRIGKFQIMFMSMGEPFLNYGSLREALVELHAKYPNAQLLVSTPAPAAISVGGGMDVLPAGPVNAAGHAAEAVNALTVLGFSASEASAAVGRLDSALPVNELVREALKSLARKG